MTVLTLPKLDAPPSDNAPTDAESLSASPSK